MSCHMVQNESITIYEALHNPRTYIESHCSDSTSTSSKWISYICIILQTIAHIHNENILHNDIKTDNFVFGLTSRGEIEPFLIDFGKACFADQGKYYQLSEEEKKIYKKNHSHIAPDLRDGLVRQSKASDIFAFGQMLYYVYYKKLKLKTQIKVIAKLCLDYNESNRPTCAYLEEMLTTAL